MTEELIVLLDDAGQHIGTAPKLASHHATTPLHQAFSCYVFNKRGELLITQRARSKKVWPGVWTNSVCGHPQPDEDIIQALKRRLDFELGMVASNFQVVLPDYRYKTPPYNGIIENEVCPVYLAKKVSEPKPNSEEVENCRWVSWRDFIRETEVDEENDYSWWCKDQLKQLKNHPLLEVYTKI